MDFFFVMRRAPPKSALFPYTTLFRSERNTLSNLHLALYSLQVMQSLRQQTNIEYGRTARGSLKVFRDQTSLDRRSEEHTSELQSQSNLVCRLLLEKKH